MGLLNLLKRILGARPRAAGPAGSAARPAKSARERHRIPFLRLTKRRRRTRGAPVQYVRQKPHALAHFSPDHKKYADRRVGEAPARLARFGLPCFQKPEDLAAWLKLPLKTLAWLADYHDRNRAEDEPRKRHYFYRWVPKAHGAGYRLIEAPKPLLKTVQTRILREILDRVPAHPAAHGFVKGRSILTHAQIHAGKYVVLKADLADFYPSVRFGRVATIFSRLGYNREVAWWLARFCTNRIPVNLAEPEGASVRFAPSSRLRARHLPQGAPTSPALANLAAWALDVRLTGLAQRFGVAYSRYADDLTFSGEEKLARGKTLLVLQQYVRGIAAHEGFVWNAGKTRLVRRSARQVVTGLTVNQTPNVPRPYFDRLKAILTNCVRHGVASQNRARHPNFRAHLEGRIAFVRSVNPQKAARLQRLLDRVPR